MLTADIDGRGSRPADAVVILLHGGTEHSRAPAKRRLPYLRMVLFARSIAAAAGGTDRLALWRLRYRYRGWNAPDLDPVEDARWALLEAERQYPGAPVVLVGHSMGGRTALYVADAPNVTAVCALAPWITDDDPIAQLAGRTLLIAHGDADSVTDPVKSSRYAERARQVTDEVCSFEVRGDGHALLRRASTWNALVSGFVTTVLGLAPPDPRIIAAINAPAPRVQTVV